MLKIWPFGRHDAGKRAPGGPRNDDVTDRLDLLEDAIARLERRFLTIQGELTGAIRYQRQLEQRLADEEEYDGDEDADEGNLPRLQRQ